MTMQPTWQTSDGAIRLFHADCLRILPTLEGVDAVVTDIPYDEVNRDSGGLRNLNKGAADVATFSVEEAAGFAMLGASAYVFCGMEQVSELRKSFVDAGLTTRLCIWEKTNPSPMNGECFWLSSIESCVFARKPKAYFAEHCKSPVWRGPVEREQVHPTQKPLWLFTRLVAASSPPDGSVLDFCMGSGTTGIACIRTGRKFIGIEKEEKYFNIAVSRIEGEIRKNGFAWQNMKKPTTQNPVGFGVETAKKNKRRKSTTL